MSLEDVQKRLAKVETSLNHLEEELKEIKQDQYALIEKVATLMGKSDTTLLLLKWVVTPLIVILGALVGIKIALPS